MTAYDAAAAEYGRIRALCDLLGVDTDRHASRPIGDPGVEIARALLSLVTWTRSTPLRDAADPWDARRVALTDAYWRAVWDCERARQAIGAYPAARGFDVLLTTLDRSPKHGGLGTEIDDESPPAFWECLHDDAETPDAQVDLNAAPPAWCPLRGAP